jgi:hypothetical protein
MGQPTSSGAIMGSYGTAVSNGMHNSQQNRHYPASSSYSGSSEKVLQVIIAHIFFN